MLRLFLAWRLLRMLFPLLLFGFAALALTARSVARLGRLGGGSLRLLKQRGARSVP